MAQRTDSTQYNPIQIQSQLNLIQQQTMMSLANAKMSGKNPTKKQLKYLVYLGDSRGQVHMTSLYFS